MSYSGYDIEHRKREREALSERSSEFERHLGSCPHQPLDSLSVKPNQIEIEIFGIKVCARSRLIITEGMFSAVEYPFRIDGDDQKQVIWALYLGSEGLVYEDSGQYC